MKKILLIDDDQDILAMLTSRLMSAGFDVVTASDGASGLKLAMYEEPDLIVLDVMMPEMDGYEVCDAIKQNEKLRSIPVILLTSLGEIQDIKKGIAKKANAYISKPFRHEDLIAEIIRLLG